MVSRVTMQHTPSIRLVAGLLCPLALLAGGCATSRFVKLSVLDAETGRPVPNAEVRNTWSIPVGPSRQTERLPGGTGRALLTQALGESSLSAGAPGYVDYHYGGVLASLDGGPITPRWFGGNVGPSSGLWGFRSVVLYLYAGPPAEVVLVVPDGYRGELRTLETYAPVPAGHVAGDRVFEFAADPDGVTPLDGTPLIAAGYAPGGVTRAR